jgi:hypothetical protein
MAAGLPYRIVQQEIEIGAHQRVIAAETSAVAGTQAARQPNGARNPHFLLVVPNQTLSDIILVGN